MCTLPTCNWNAICYGKLSLHLSVKFTLGCLPVVVVLAGCHAVMAPDHGTWPPAPAPAPPPAPSPPTSFIPPCLRLSLLGS